MPSGYETILAEATDRMKVAGAKWPSAANVRRAHRTAVPRDDSGKIETGLQIIDGKDEPAPQSQNATCAMRQCDFTIGLLVRSDAGPAAADPMKIEVMRRMAQPWPDGVCVNPGRVTVDDEVADIDAVRVNMEFSATYPTAGEWNL